MWGGGGNDFFVGRIFCLDPQEANINLFFHLSAKIYIFVSRRSQDIFNMIENRFNYSVKFMHDLHVLHK